MQGAWQSCQGYSQQREKHDVSRSPSGDRKGPRKKEAGTRSCFLGIWLEGKTGAAVQQRYIRQDLLQPEGLGRKVRGEQVQGGLDANCGAKGRQVARAVSGRGHEVAPAVGAAGLLG